MLKNSCPRGINYSLNNKKRAGLFLLFILLLGSCNSQMNCEEIRKEVRSRPVHPVLYNLVEMYCHAYYVLPKEYDELYQFVISYKENEPASFSELEYYTDVDILKAFAPHNVRYAFFKDSVFFLLRTRARTASCYFIGDQFYRLSHTEVFLPDEMNFWSSFKSSAFNSEGDYLFRSQFNYSELDSSINSVSKKYNALVLAKGYYTKRGEHVLDRVLTNGITPLRGIIYFSGIDDSISIISEIPPVTSLLVKSKNSDSQLDTICMNTPVPLFCQAYLSEIKDKIIQSKKSCPNLGSFMTTIPLFGNIE